MNKEDQRRVRKAMVALCDCGLSKEDATTLSVCATVFVWLSTYAPQTAEVAVAHIAELAKGGGGHAHLH